MFLKENWGKNCIHMFVTIISFTFKYAVCVKIYAFPDKSILNWFFVGLFLKSKCVYCDPAIGSCRMSDFSLTNSLATSSLLRCDKILSIVHPVSSICMRLNNGNQRAQER